MVSFWFNLDYLNMFNFLLILVSSLSHFYFKILKRGHFGLWRSNWEALTTHLGKNTLHWREEEVTTNWLIGSVCWEDNTSPPFNFFNKKKGGEWKKREDVWPWKRRKMKYLRGKTQFFLFHCYFRSLTSNNTIRKNIKATMSTPNNNIMDHLLHPTSTPISKFGQPKENNSDRQHKPPKPSSLPLPIAPFHHYLLVLLFSPFTNQLSCLDDSWFPFCFYRDAEFFISFTRENRERERERTHLTFLCFDSWNSETWRKRRGSCFVL